MDNYHYPSGTDTNDAPWNKPEKKERVWFEFCVQDLKNPEAPKDKDGEPLKWEFEIVKVFSGKGEGFLFRQAIDYAKKFRSVFAEVVSFDENDKAKIEWRAIDNAL